MRLISSYRKDIYTLTGREIEIIESRLRYGCFCNCNVELIGNQMHVSGMIDDIKFLKKEINMIIKNETKLN